MYYSESSLLRKFTCVILIVMQPAEKRASKFDSSHVCFQYLRVNPSLFER
jgi:hypothetical protein